MIKVKIVTGLCVCVYLCVYLCVSERINRQHSGLRETCRDVVLLLQ